MSTSYAKEALSQEKKDNQRRLHENNERVWSAILDSTDQTPGTAFANRVIAWCGGELSMEKYDALCLTCAIPGFETKDWHRGNLQFYVNLVVDKLRNSYRWDDERIRAKVKELSNKTKPEVRAYLQELGFREQVRTLDEAKSFLQRHRLLESQQKFYFTKDGTRHERLPSLVVPEGHVQARPLDAFFLIRILDATALRRYCERYSSEQINERIASTSPSLRGES